MKRIEEKVHDQDKEAHLEYMRQQIKLIEIEKKRIKNETVQTQSKPVTPSVQQTRPPDDEVEAVNRIENETAQTQSKPVIPSIQHLA